MTRQHMRWLIGIGAGLLAARVGWAAEPTISPEAQELIAKLDAKDVYERQKTFLRLEALREPATAAAIRERIRSRNAHTREFSVRALAAVEGAGAIPTVVERLREDRVVQVRLAALLALEPLQTYDSSLTLVFIRALRDRSPDVRMAAADVVSRINHPIAREAVLTRWRQERHRDVRRVLEDAMKRIGALGQ